MTSTTAIILAGGRNSPEMEAATGVQNRALVELADNKTMLDFVVDAVRGASRVRAVFVVGNVPPLDGVTVVAPGDSLMDNMLRGLDAAGSPHGERALIVTSDIPFITAEAVDDYLDKAQATDADFCYPIIPMHDYLRQFAGMKRTTLKLREGKFTGGNMILLNPERVLANRDVISRAYAGRKNVLALGHMLGWGLLLRIVISQAVAPNLLNVPLLETGIACILGPSATARAIVTTFASIGTNVDKPDDVAYAKDYFAARSAEAVRK